MNCPVCDREADEEGYCKQHAEANRILIKKYDRWKEALDISWKEYLSEIAKNPLTGDWARKVAQYLLEMENQKNVKSG